MFCQNAFPFTKWRHTSLADTLMYGTPPLNPKCDGVIYCRFRSHGHDFGFGFKHHPRVWSPERVSKTRQLSKQPRGQAIACLSRIKSRNRVFEKGLCQIKLCFPTRKLIIAQWLPRSCVQQTTLLRFPFYIMSGSTLKGFLSILYGLVQHGAS